MRRTAAAIYLLFFLAPLAWYALTSFWPEDELHSLAPTHLSAIAYVRVIRDRPFPQAILNSAIVAGSTTVFCLAIGSVAAFAIAKLDFRGRSAILAAALAVSMFPGIAIVSPLYLLLRALGLRDTLAGLVLPYSTFALPLTLWVLTSFFRQIPDDLYRAARVDGCTPFQAFRRVFLPLAAPALATTGILVFISAWNELLFALTFVSSPERHTIPVAITLFPTGHIEPWPEIAAASVISTAPLIVLVLAFQRRIVSGLTAGAVKA